MQAAVVYHAQIVLYEEVPLYRPCWSPSPGFQWFVCLGLTLAKAQAFPPKPKPFGVDFGVWGVVTEARGSHLGGMHSPTELYILSPYAENVLKLGIYLSGGVLPSISKALSLIPRTRKEEGYLHKHTHTRTNQRAICQNKFSLYTMWDRRMELRSSVLGSKHPCLLSHPVGPLKTSQIRKTEGREKKCEVGPISVKSIDRAISTQEHQFLQFYFITQLYMPFTFFCKAGVEGIRMGLITPH